MALLITFRKSAIAIFNLLLFFIIVPVGDFLQTIGYLVDLVSGIVLLVMLTRILLKAVVCTP